jgi:hypothetical protein
MRKRQVLAMLLAATCTMAGSGQIFADEPDGSTATQAFSGTEVDGSGGLQIPSGIGAVGANGQSSEEDSVAEGTQGRAADTDATTDEEKAKIESALDLSKNEEVTWSYDSETDSWTMSPVSAVVNPEIEEEQGVSVNIPGAYVTGIDTDGDGKADVTADCYTEAVHGMPVMDYDASVTSENGQVYTASTAPCIITTGAAGYSEQQNQNATGQYAADGYISVACGNRGKQSTAENDSGETYYTGDAPDCLVDQKDAIRFVKYNILLGNLPGSVDYFVSTGGSGGGAHAAMVAATSNNSDFYDYEIEAGAVGVYRNEDGTYSTTVTIDGKDYELSDGVWGCIAYSPITSLAEADMAMAFEYTLDSSYSFNTDFQKQLASVLSQEYMDYINSQNLTVRESDVGFDLNEDGDTDDTVNLTIEYDTEKYSDTNGYGGTYLTYYLDEFKQNLQWYLENLDYADDWTWFDEDGNTLSDEEVAAMTTEDKAEAFIEGRYAKSGNTSGGPGMGNPGDGGKGLGQPGTDGAAPSGQVPNASVTESSGAAAPDQSTSAQDQEGSSEETTGGQQVTDGTEESGQGESANVPAGGNLPQMNGGGTEVVGTPDSGTTQASGSSTDSENYSSYDEMLSAYEADVAEIEAGDKYGNNIVELYNPLNYIGDDGTEVPVWTRLVCGASEGDISMFNSLNMQIAWLNAGTDCTIEWQWDGGHVPSEILGESLSLYVDEMYGQYVDGAVKVTKAAAAAQTTNGTQTEATGTDISSWVTLDKDTGEATFSLADAARYRTAGASKAIPGFDVMDYGQECYEFGDSDSDARHWDKYVLKALQDARDELEPLFNQSAGSGETESEETGSGESES